MNLRRFIHDLILARKIKRLAEDVQDLLDMGYHDAAVLLWLLQGALLDQCSPRMQAKLRGLLHP